MSATNARQQTTAVIYLRPFARDAAPVPAARYFAADADGVTDIFVLIAEQLLPTLDQKDAEIAFLRAALKHAQQELTFFHVRAVDLLAGWDLI
jgi:hypothetical protein